MKTLECTVMVDEILLGDIKKYMEATVPEFFQGEDNRLSCTATFPDGLKMDIQCCGCRDDSSWTQAVLYNEYGGELCFTDPEDYFVGDWELEYEGTKYVVHVVPEAD